MADLLRDDTDFEMLRYQEAEELAEANYDPNIFLDKKSVFNAETKTHDVLLPLYSGGYVKLGEEGVKVDRPGAILLDGMEYGPDTPEYQRYYPTPSPLAMTEAPAMGQPAVTEAAPEVSPQTKIEDVQSYAQQLQEQQGAYTLEDLTAAGYSEDAIAAAGLDVAIAPPQTRTEELTPEEVDKVLAEGGSLFTSDPTLRQQGAQAVEAFAFDLAVEGLRDELEASGVGQRTIEEEIKARTPELLKQAEIASNILFGTKNPLEFGIADFTTGGIMDIQEGYRMFQQSRQGETESMTGRAIGMGMMLAGVAEATGVGLVAGKLMKKGLLKLQPTIAQMGADAEQRIAQEGNMLFSNPVGPLVDRGLAAAGRLAQLGNVKLGPPSDVPLVSQLQPQYRVTVEGAEIVGTGKQSFIPKKMTPKNYTVSSESLKTLETEFADPLSSPENYALMMSRVQNSTEVPAPPVWMIENANNIDQWANWFKGLTADQIKAADEGLAIQGDFRAAYDAGAGPELTGQLMLWSILSRRLSAFPHEGGYLELAEAATPFIQKASSGKWTDADTDAWLEMVKTTIPEGTPGRSSTSNANDFGKVFLKKMAAVDENGVSALSRLHQMIADPNMSSTEIRRAYYGLAEDTGIANKILSFALLVSGRNDVVVLDRIQINRMWAGGEKIYDDVYTQFEGAQGLAQYEALERSLASRVEEMYAKAGREGAGSVGRYHWESWVLSSGQVVSHPTLSAVVGSGSKSSKSNLKPTELTPVREGRFHVKYSGVQYEKTPGGGNRYVYRTSGGDAYQFTKNKLDDMFKEVFSKKSGVLPSNFPGVASFEGGNKPWYEFEGVDREKFDAIIRSFGKPVSD